MEDEDMEIDEIDKDDFQDMLNEYIQENKDKYGEDLQRKFVVDSKPVQELELDEYEEVGEGVYLVPGELVEKIERKHKTNL